MKKLKLNIDITLEVEDERADMILNDGKATLLATLFCGNSDYLGYGQWYPEGNFTVTDGSKTYIGKVK